MFLVETKQVLDLAFMLAAEIAKVAKDGFQLADLVTIFQDIEGDEVKKAAFLAAIKDVKDVPAELKQIDLAGGMDLAVYLVGKVPAVVAEFKA